MALRWADSDVPVTQLPRSRRPFFEDVRRRLLVDDPSTEERIESEVRPWLDAVALGHEDLVSVKKCANSDWTGFERQAIFEVTEDMDESRWWLGLMLMNIAIEHPRRFMAYKPDPGSELATSYFRDPRDSVG